MTRGQKEQETSAFWDTLEKTLTVNRERAASSPKLMTCCLALYRGPLARWDVVHMLPFRVLENPFHSIGQDSMLWTVVENCADQSTMRY